MTKQQMKTEKTKIIILGGLDGIDRNMMLLEYKNEVLIIDMGLKFPEESTPGIDCIIPDVSYLVEGKKKIIGTIFTHGHYDHIGAVPYLLDKLGNAYPMYAGAMAKEIVLRRQQEFPYKDKLNIQVVKDGQKQKIGPFDVEFVKMNHSIPDTFGLLIETPSGKIFHSADFRFDEDPIFETPTDLKKLERIGQEGVLLLLSDSTGAEKEGWSLSEKMIMENLEKIFKDAPGRIITSTFASLLIRIQEIIVLSEKYGRKIVIEGRSMKANIEAAQKLGHIKIKKGAEIKTKNIQSYPDSKITIISTGAQGEKRASLTRIASKEHKYIRFKESDTVIFSSSTVPGNERSVRDLKESILKQGPEVYDSDMMDIHTSGHASQDEIMKLMTLIKPKFVMPIHGQYSMLRRSAVLAEKTGVLKKNIIIGENGAIMTLSENSFSKEKEKAPSGYVLVDGLGVGDIGKVVIRDRKALADDGIFVVIVVVDRKTGKLQNSPDIISRGFIYLNESKALLTETRKKVTSIVNQTPSDDKVNYKHLKKEIQEKVASYLYTKTHRRPMVLPVVIGL